MIRVEIALFASLRRYHPQGGRGKAAFTLPVKTGITLGEIGKILGIPPEEIKLKFVNNRHKTPDYTVEDGDKIAIFPPVAGG